MLQGFRDMAGVVVEAGAIDCEGERLAGELEQSEVVLGQLAPSAAPPNLEDPEQRLLRYERNGRRRALGVHDCLPLGSRLAGEALERPDALVARRGARLGRRGEHEFVA